MKVKLKVSLGGPKVSHGIGDVVEFDDATADRLIEIGYGTAAGPRSEKADAPKPETAEAKRK